MSKELIAYKLGKKASQAAERTLWLLEQANNPQFVAAIRNLSEDRFQTAVIHFAETHGWEVHHLDSRRAIMRGFPNLWLIREAGEYKSGTQRQTLIKQRECKDMTGKLTPEQDRMQYLIGSAGGDVGVWRPCDWERIKRELE